MTMIRADYEMLKNISRLFRQEGQSTEQILRRVGQSMHQLRSGDWLGQGARKFYQEMNDSVLPSISRLSLALDQADRTTRAIIKIMEGAEQEAARILRGDNAGPASRGGDGASGAGGAGGSDGSQAGGGEGSRGLWDGWELKRGTDLWTFEDSKGGKYSPGIKLKHGKSGALVGDPNEEGVSVLGYEYGVGAGFSEDSFTIGPYGELYGFQYKTDGVIGDEDFGLTAGGGAKVLSADGFVGVKDYSLGGSIGANLASADGSVGVNVAGYNVSLTGEIGYKYEYGFQLGKETEVKLPLVSLGVSFGKAVKPDAAPESAVGNMAQRYPDAFAGKELP